MRGVKEAALILSFTGLALALSVIPAFPIIGFSGTITLGALAGSMLALYLDPRLGLISVLLVIAATPFINPGLISVLGLQLYYLPIVFSWSLAVLYYRFKPYYSLALFTVYLVILVVSHGVLLRYYVEYLVYDALTPPIYLLLHYLLRRGLGEGVLRAVGGIVYGVIGDHIGGSTAAAIYYLYIMGLYNQFLSNSEALKGWVTVWRSVAYIYPVERTILIIIGLIAFIPSIRAWRRYYEKIMGGKE